MSAVKGLAAGVHGLGFFSLHDSRLASTKSSLHRLQRVQVAALQRCSVRVVLRGESRGGTGRQPDTIRATVHLYMVLERGVHGVKVQASWCEYSR